MLTRTKCNLPKQNRKRETTSRDRFKQSFRESSRSKTPRNSKQGRSCERIEANVLFQFCISGNYRVCCRDGSRYENLIFTSDLDDSRWSFVNTARVRDRDAGNSANSVSEMKRTYRNRISCYNDCSVGYFAKVLDGKKIESPICQTD